MGREEEDEKEDGNVLNCIDQKTSFPLTVSGNLICILLCPFPLFAYILHNPTTSYLLIIPFQPDLMSRAFPKQPSRTCRQRSLSSKRPPCQPDNTPFQAHTI